MKKILLIGKNSFIASKLFFFLSHNYIIDRISHNLLDDISINNYDFIINCSLHPALRISNYQEDLDIDLKIARKFHGHYIMFSSRKVYGTSNELLTYTEKSSINPNDYYGHNKFITEEKIRQVKEAYTIFRASNVFGFEYNRISYMGFFMNQLKEKDSILINVSPYTARDIIYIDDVINLINLSLDKKILGTYNLSSNIGELVGNIGNYLIEGYGSGSLLSTSKNLQDQFILSNDKLLQRLDIKEYNFNYSSVIKELGEQLCKI